MSEKIYLKVPSEPAANEASHGNHSAVLTPGKVIEVKNRKFADWLVREFACAEVDGDQQPAAGDSGSELTEKKAQGNKIGGKK